MTLHKNIFSRISSQKTFVFRFLLLTFLLFTFAFLLLVYPEITSKGISRGINVCLNTVIPSLYPFLIISNIAYDSGLLDYFSRKCEKISRFLFALPAESLPVILMSFLGGFPVGAILIGKSYDNKALSRSQAQRLLLFCVNPGPAFVVSTVGYSIIGSKQAGLIICIAITLSALIVGVLSRFLAVDEEFFSTDVSCENKILNSFSLSETVSNCTENILNICAWVTIFSCLGELATIVFTSGEALVFFRMISEVTNGVITASEHFTLPIVAAVISFSGFCVHFQIMPVLIKIRLKYKFFLSVRILCAALSCVLTFILSELFPQYSQVISIGTKPETATLKSTIPVCVWLMLMCGLLILGDNYILKNNLKEI